MQSKREGLFKEYKSLSLHYNKVKVLAELVEPHFEKEEENEMLKEVKEQMDEAARGIIGRRYTEIKNELERLYRPRGIPTKKFITPLNLS